MARISVTAMGLAVLALVTASPAPTDARWVPAAAQAAPLECGLPRSAAQGVGVTAAAVRNGVLRMYDRSVAIDPATINLSVSPVDTPPWRLWYHSLVWLTPLAVESYEAGDVAGTRLVAAYVRAAVRTTRDPGWATAAARAQARRTGWDEGTNTRRQQSLNCLVQIQPDASVSGLLEASIRVNLDARRYYGLPRARPHNHGLMANLTLIDTGGILGRAGLLDRAQYRLLTDVRAVRDPACGMTYEQSAPYQGVNARIWGRTAERLARAGRTAAAARLRAAAVHMAGAYDHLVTPSGVIAAVGHGGPNTGFILPSHRATRMLCRVAGWAAGRTAWTPAATHYTLHFGPRRQMHGHADHGSVTWSVAGDTVLVDTGNWYDSGSAAARYANTNAAHNVLGVSGMELERATTLVRAAWRPLADSYTVRDVVPLATRTRSVRIDRALPLLMVLDRATATRTRSFTQRWHFASVWRATTTPSIVRSGDAIAGVVALDLRTGRMLSVRATSAVLFPTTRTVSRGRQLYVRTSGTSTAIFSVAYRSAGRTRPVLRWLPGSTPGSGIVRVWWGRVHRDIHIDRTGVLAG
jgi:hypothetical protein